MLIPLAPYLFAKNYEDIVLMKVKTHISVRAAKERGISHEEMHSEVEYIVAHGIASRVGGKRVVIGSAHFIFEDEGCTIPAGEQAKFDGLDRCV